MVTASGPDGVGPGDVAGRIIGDHIVGVDDVVAQSLIGEGQAGGRAGLRHRIVNNRYYLAGREPAHGADPLAVNIVTGRRRGSPAGPTRPETPWWGCVR